MIQSSLSLFRLYPHNHILHCFFISMIIVFFTISLEAAEMDYFGDLILSDGSKKVEPAELILQVEDPKPPQPKDLIQLGALQLKVFNPFVATYFPKLRDPKIIHAPHFKSGVRIQRGTRLLLNFKLSLAKGVTSKRTVRLYSNVRHPKYKLPNKTFHELNADGVLSLNWKRSSHKKYISYVGINNHVQMSTKKGSTHHDLLEHDVVLQTANLKSGQYKFFVRIYRQDGKKTIEKEVQQFNFTVVDAPIYLAADIPASVVAYGGEKSFVSGRYDAKLSDWAVPPFQAMITSSGQALTLYDGKKIGELDESLVELLLRPKQRDIGQNLNIRLQVTDGLGRVAVFKRSLRIRSGANTQLLVTMPKSIKAGQTIQGTVRYPDRFRLKKQPRITDKKGFSWTSSDYTSFQIKVKEEGVDHQRLFAIIASGTVRGVDDDSVMVWKREYRVHTQNPIYKPKPQPTDNSSHPSGRDAFTQLMIGDRRPITTQASDDSSSSHSKTYEIVSVETYDDDSPSTVDDYEPTETVRHGSGAACGIDPETSNYERVDTWLFLGKVKQYKYKYMFHNKSRYFTTASGQRKYELVSFWKKDCRPAKKGQVLNNGDYVVKSWNYPLGKYDPRDKFWAAQGSQNYNRALFNYGFTKKRYLASTKKLQYTVSYDRLGILIYRQERNEQGRMILHCDDSYIGTREKISKCQ